MAVLAHISSRSYDLKSSKTFLTEAKLAGGLGVVKYVASHAIGKGVTGLTLASKQSGLLLKAVGNSADMLTTLSVKGDASIHGRSIDFEPTYLVKKKASRLTVSAVLGHGLSAAGVLQASNAGEMKTDYQLSYDKKLGAGRGLSASVNPGDRAGEVELIDSKTEPGALWVAHLFYGLGDKPKLKLKRSMKF